MPTPRTLRETLLDHLDERDGLVGAIVEAGMSLVTPHLDALVATAAPRGAREEAVAEAAAALTARIGAIVLAAHSMSEALHARHRLERITASGPRGPIVRRLEREARRLVRG